LGQGKKACKSSGKGYELMISNDDLRRLILESVSNLSNFQFGSICNKVSRLIRLYDLGTFNRDVELKINEIVWDLVVERILTLGTDNHSEPKWPFLRLTEFGKKYISNSQIHYYDPDKYLSTLEVLIPELDEITALYTIEALRCFRRNLMFAAAVMLGAAAERAVLILLEEIHNWETNEGRKKKIRSVLERPSMPKIFDLIRGTINNLIEQKEMPYEIHEGVMDHLISVHEMVRVQRNDAVHPTTAQVSRNKVFLSIQAFPVVLQVLFRVKIWFVSSSAKKID